MKILILTPFFPYPLNAGGKTWQYHIMRKLSENHKITLLSFIENKKELEYVDNVLPFCEKIETVLLEREKPLPRTRIGRFLNLFNIVFSPFPHYLVEKYYSKEFKDEFAELLREDDFDVILFQFTPMGLYFDRDIKPPQVLIEIDIFFEKEKSYYITIPWSSSILKIENLIHLLKSKGWEMGLWRKFKYIITLSKDDKLEIERLNRHPKVFLVQIGADIEYYRPKETSEKKEQILFLGAANNTLNFFGINWFLDKIWPLVLNESPNVKLLVLGTGFDGILDHKAYKNVKEIGFVDDMRPYFEQSRVFIVPILSGSGARLKIAEAMAMGMPIVSTAIGVKGMEAESGKQIIIADKPKDFANSVLKLLGNEGLREKIGKNGRRLVELKYSWDIACKQLEEALSNLTKMRA